MEVVNNAKLGGASTQMLTMACVLFVVIGVGVVGTNSYNEADQRAQAIGDVRSLAEDILRFRNDMGDWPGLRVLAFTDGNPALGEMELAGGGVQVVAAMDLLGSNTKRLRCWNGPYLRVLRPDPWGCRYAIVLNGSREGAEMRGWILSAGPNGIIETHRGDADLQGDDLGLPIR